MSETTAVKEGGGGGGGGHAPVKAEPESQSQQLDQEADPRLYMAWLLFCFFGIMCAFILYGLVMEYATSGGRKLHELSLIFVTSSVYAMVGYTSKIVRGEPDSPVPTYKLLVVAMSSIGSTWTSVRSLRYVIFPVQVLAKSCKPIPVMLMGALMGKSYPLRKYVNVGVITLGVALFMGGGDDAGKGKSNDADSASSAEMMLGVILLFISLCFDGGTGAYEDKLMSTANVGAFELMYNIQLGKAILAGMALIFFNEINYFFVMVGETGPLLFFLGLSGAVGQVFIFVTIAKFGALTCSIIGLARKIVTLVASIIIYAHPVNWKQMAGLCMAVGAMIYNFLDKGGKKKGGAKPKAAVEGTLERDVEAAREVELRGLLHNEGGCADELDEEAALAAGRAVAAASDAAVADAEGGDEPAPMKKAFKPKKGHMGKAGRRMSTASKAAALDLSADATD